MSCEGQDYHNKTREELLEHQRFHYQALKEAEMSRNPKRAAIEQLKAMKMSYALWQLPDSDRILEGAPTNPDASIAEIDLKLGALEFQGGQNG